MHGHLTPDSIDELGLSSGQLVGLAVAEGVGAGIALVEGAAVRSFSVTDAIVVIRTIESTYSPRWVWWDQASARTLANADVIVDRCWDVLAVHRLLHGGVHWTIAQVWASLHDLPFETIPELGQLDLLGTATHDAGDDAPVQADGHLSPGWLELAWRTTPSSLARWAELSLAAASLQLEVLSQPDRGAAGVSTAHAESMASMLCAEMERCGLPIDVSQAGSIIGDLIGPRGDNARTEAESRDRRDAAVLQHVEPRQNVNLRSSTEVRAMLRRLDIEVEDTRAWRLEQVRDAHPVVDALLTWRKAERVSTTYGYRWLDEHVRDGRLRGSWSSSDGSAGRMTASAGLHNLPSEMRPAIAAEPGHLFVRADLGQIEPRVLAAVSGDEAFIAATRRDDLYHEVAQQLDVERAVAKLAVLGAMYGATTGESAHALRRLEKAYPIAMGFLADAARSGRERVDITTVGGRRIRLSGGDGVTGNLDAARSAAEARGRYARNAVIQGAAAEFFKVWAIVVRRRARELDGAIVLCLHDELLLHVPAENANELSLVVSDAVGEAAHYWSPSPTVRFVADVSVLERWSDAK